MNLRPDEIKALIQNHARIIAEGRNNRRDMDGPVPLNKSDLIETLERILQLAKELP